MNTSSHLYESPAIKEVELAAESVILADSSTEPGLRNYYLNDFYEE